MSLISAAEDRLLDKYLDDIDCTGMCGDDPCTCDELEQEEDYEDDEPDWETEAEDRAERMAERW